MKIFIWLPEFQIHKFGKTGISLLLKNYVGVSSAIISIQLVSSRQMSQTLDLSANIHDFENNS